MLQFLHSNAPAPPQGPIQYKLQHLFVRCSQSHLNHCFKGMPIFLWLWTQQMFQVKHLESKEQNDTITFWGFTTRAAISEVTTLTMVVMSSLKRSEKRVLRKLSCLSVLCTYWAMLFTYSGGGGNVNMETGDLPEHCGKGEKAGRRAH